MVLINLLLVTPTIHMLTKVCGREREREGERERKRGRKRERGRERERASMTLYVCVPLQIPQTQL